MPDSAVRRLRPLHAEFQVAGPARATTQIPSSFSAMSAHDRLVTLLGDETPHPIGSAANILVKGRLVEQLTQLGLTTEVQDDRCCSFKWPVCGRVAERARENRRGAHRRHPADGTLRLGAVRDPAQATTASASPTLLEVARVLRDAPKPRNSILFAFTDGEEAGPARRRGVLLATPVGERRRRS